MSLKTDQDFNHIQEQIINDDLLDINELYEIFGHEQICQRLS